MQKFLVFAGTTEGREALELLAGTGRELWASVATEYGGECLPALPGLHTLTGRLDKAAATALLMKERFTCVFDATHPYATEATGNILAACKRTGTRYVRILRNGELIRENEVEQGEKNEHIKPESIGKSEQVILVQSAEEAARYLCEHAEGNVLLTTGSKELAAFTGVPKFSERLFPRVLPVAASLEKCASLGFSAKNIVCMQGPFTAELNAALLRQIGACWLVTKETGVAGGFPEKCAGARLAGAQVLVIGRPHEENGITLSQLAELFPPGEAGEAVSGEQSPNISPYFPLFVSLAGKTAVVLGGGRIAARRARALVDFGCRVRVIAPEGLPPAKNGPQQEDKNKPGLWDDMPQGTELLRRSYQPGDCSGAALVVAATNNRAANAAAARECALLGVLISVADCKEESTFYFPGLVRRGSVVIGVTASGTNHGLAKAVTQRIQQEAARIISHNEEENE